jgi:mxaL protein
LAQLPCGSRFGLAIFVERQPFLLFEPVETCENFSALDDEIRAIDWRMGWDSESHIGETLLASLRLVRRFGADLVFMTDGQETPPVSWDGAPDFTGMRGSVHGLVLGVGGRNFSPIPKYDTYGREIGVYKAGDVPSETAGLFRGREHLSAVDEPHLRALAADTGLDYRHLDGETDLFAAYHAQARPIMRKERTRLAWVAGCLALLFMLASMLPRRPALSR